MHGKTISGVKVYSYEECSNLSVDLGLVASANSVIEIEIAQTIANNTNNGEVFVFSQQQSTSYDNPTVAVEGYNDNKGDKSEGEQAVKELIQWARHT